MLVHEGLLKKVILNKKHYHLNRNQYRSLRDKADRINELSSGETALIGHGIKSPLTRIVTLSELLLKEIPGTLNHEQKEYVQDIYNNSFLLLNAINSLLTITKGETGFEKLNMELFNVKDMLESVVARVDSIAVSRGTQFVFDVSDELPLVYCDRYKIEQVLYNLIDNAMKFTYNGTITVSAKELPDNSIQIAVADTGIGIEEENLSKIFDKFYTDKNPFNLGGSGLGLSVVQEIVSLHNGRVWVESTEGKGTTVTFVIPNSGKAATGTD